uniref:Saposin B-type domain-containing protein n=1 Tax=Junco hyemalis TaxID=40217 RepID=A0A8C5IZ20_JUNHY
CWHQGGIQGQAILLKSPPVPWLQGAQGSHSELSGVLAQPPELCGGGEPITSSLISCRMEGCSCMALKSMQDLAGDDPDEVRALQKGCRALGRRLGKQCQQLVSKYQEQISEGLQNGDMPKDICTAIGLCRKGVGNG